MTILGNRFLAERVKHTRTMSEGGIHLPPVVLDDLNTGGVKEWLVLQVGPGRRNRDGTQASLEFVPGDRVLFRSFSTGPVQVGDTNQYILDAEGVIAIIPQNEMPIPPAGEIPV